MMRLSTPLAVLALGLGLSACSPAQPAESPSAPLTDGQGPGAAGPEDAQEPAGPKADILYAPHDAVPEASDSCLDPGPLPPSQACTDSDTRLAEALSKSEQDRDRALAPLEACAEFPRGLIRALRAELGQATCADVFVASVVGEDVQQTELPPDIREALVALGLGARLRRLAVDPPTAPQSQKKEELDKYFKDELFPWVAQQAQAIYAMAHQGTGLSGYARGVVAIEAGNADMRFVEIVREVPLAKEIAEFQEATDLYYTTLDEQLEPRKARGRNAALVGLREMARIGVRNNARVSSARSLLSRAYGGRRVNALDTLLVPNLEPEKAESDAAVIASQVPTAYAAALVGDAPITANLIRAHLQQGMTIALRRAVEADTEAGVTKLLVARALFESGRSYFRAVDFQAAQSIVGLVLKAQGTSADGATKLTESQLKEALLLQALSVALLAGPKDAAEMIAKGPRFAETMGNLKLLDELAERKDELGGQAAFNAAYLRELVAPPGSPDYWSDLAARYKAASKKLAGKDKKSAAERGAACEEIATEIEAELSASKKAN